jgi:hypothetical protein
MSLAVLGMVLYGYFSSQTLPRAPSVAGYTKVPPFVASEKSMNDLIKAEQGESGLLPKIKDPSSMDR